MSDFEPVRIVRGDGKEFWQPQCDGLLLWAAAYKTDKWAGQRPARDWARVRYRFKWMARHKGKKEAKRWFSREDADQ